MNSDIPVYYSWEVPEGFDILPKSGYLPQKKTDKLVAMFSPKSARVYDASALCTFSEQSDPMELGLGGFVINKMMKLEGTGKYVHLYARPCVGSGDCSGPCGSNEMASELKKEFENFSLDFGSVAVGRFSDKLVKVTNISQVCFYRNVFALSLL